MAVNIALLPGDGVGPELVDAVVPFLTEVADAHGFAVETTRYDWGSRRYLDAGEMMPADATDRLAGHDAILLGAMGHPEVPNHLSSREGHLLIRNRFDQYLNVRPAYLFDGVESPLRGYAGGEIDILWYRENSEGEYVDLGGIFERGGDEELAIQSAIYTEKGVERVVRAAFETAREREGLVTSVTKSNALPYGPVFWDNVVEDVASEYPDVTLETLLVDAANMDIVRRPDEFDVVVAPNLFSDIITDLTATVSGGIGLAPSANLSPDTDYPGMFEPVHGSAPDIAGEGVANPLAMVLSVGLLLEDVGQEAAAARVRTLVADQLADPNAPRTPDLGGESGTVAVVADLRDRIDVVAE